MLSFGRAANPEWWLLTEEQLLTAGGEALQKRSATHDNVWLVLENNGVGKSEVMSFCMQQYGFESGVAVESATLALDVAYHDWCARHMGKPKGTAKASAQGIISAACEGIRTGLEEGGNGEGSGSFVDLTDADLVDLTGAEP
jgi:hypothetical protein